jgi:phosphoserine phosphatase RsbU/P
MRDRMYLGIFLLGAGALLYAGRDLLARSTLVTWGLTFAGTTAAAVLGMTLYRVQLELRASRHELARQEAELNFASEVQQALFPRHFPADQGLEFAGVCVPARGISGDYYDVIPLQDGRLAFVIADISGKGISAAILMSNLHAVLRTLAQAAWPPRDIFLQLNRHLSQISDNSRFATMFYAEWSRAERRLNYINAGHNAPILSCGRDAHRLDQGGLPLGIIPEAVYQVGTVELQPGNLIALYSDGITEAMDRSEEMFGEPRLREIVAAHCGRPLAEVQQRVLDSVREWAGAEPHDDMTLLLVRVAAGGQEAQ